MAFFIQEQIKYTTKVPTSSMMGWWKPCDLSSICLSQYPQEILPGRWTHGNATATEHCTH